MPWIVRSIERIQVELATHRDPTNRRAQQLRSVADVVVLPGLGHRARKLYESAPRLKFLLAD